MSDNVSITPGAGNTVAADEVTDGTLGTVKVQYVKLMDGALDGTNKAVVNANGLKVDGSAVTQPVSGTFFQATQPISGTITVANPGLTDTQLRATPVPISGTITSTPSGTQTVSGTVAVSNFPASQAVTGSFFQATQPVSIATMPSTPVTGTFFQATQPVSLAAAPTTPVTGTFFQATQPISGTVSATQGTPPWVIVQTPNSLLVSATAATGVAVTATLPAVAGQFHYIGLIEVTKIFTAANAASATPLVITSTNLPGPWALSFGQPLGTIGTEVNKIHTLNSPLKSSVANTNTTIVCPATVGIIWRVTVYYYAAV